MNGLFKKYGFFKNKKRDNELDPDMILADIRGEAIFDADRFEGRLEKPISRHALLGIAAAGLVIIAVFCVRAWVLQIHDGASFSMEATENTLHSTPLFATRGLIYDRNGIPLAWNVPGPAGDPDVPRRQYSTTTGLSDTIGYIQYPSKDSAGFYYQEDFVGEAGVEGYFNDILQGQNGLKLIEVDAHDDIQSQNLMQPPVAGQSLTLSIDSRIESELYDSIQEVATQHGFTGGAGIIMDVHTGEVIAMTTYPEYSSQVMTDKTDAATIQSYFSDPQNPFLNRAVNGLYAPGSTVKPYVALGALNENIIDPSTKILSTGSISLPNPYDPSHPSVFMDWRPQGWVDMEDALAVSSDVYFYEVGGGYEDQHGLGITRLDQYFALFGFGQSLTNPFFAGDAGTVPSPAWKAANFPDDSTWRIGDTYHTAIGQYGFQVSPVQMVRAIAAVANDGDLIEPTILKAGPDSTPTIDRVIDIPQADFDVVHAGLEEGVQKGTDTALDVPYVDIAAKSGTAQVGVNNQFDNSWITGYWPANDPRYAFAVVMEHGPIANLIGAPAAMRYTLDWMNANTPEYFK